MVAGLTQTGGLRLLALILALGMGTAGPSPARELLVPPLGALVQRNDEVADLSGEACAARLAAATFVVNKVSSLPALKTSRPKAIFMQSISLGSPRRHLPLLLVLAVAACGGGSTGSEGVAVVSASGSSVTPAPTATPTPTPTPSATMAMPMPSGTSVAAPSLSGLDPIASAITVSDFLQPTWGTGVIPGLNPGNAEGAFRFGCAPSHLAYDDPIVYPGQPGKSHLHVFFGNTKADANSTYRSLRTSGESTCENVLNRSAYWAPAMLNGAGKAVMPFYISVYYKRLPASDARCQQVARACVALPRGLRYIFGYNMGAPNDASQSRFLWTCITKDNQAVNGGVTIAEALNGCPMGSTLVGRKAGPNCWNGTELDSADHRSHVVYTDPATAHCPADHPYMLPFFEIGIWYTVDATTKDWYLSSDHMPGMPELPAGTTMHTDWFGAWEDSVMDMWTSNCLDKRLDCSGGDLGNGQQLKNLTSADGSGASVLVDVPARPN